MFTQQSLTPEIIRRLTDVPQRMWGGCLVHGPGAYPQITEYTCAMPIGHGRTPARMYITSSG